MLMFDEADAPGNTKSALKKGFDIDTQLSQRFSDLAETSLTPSRLAAGARADSMVGIHKELAILVATIASCRAALACNPSSSAPVRYKILSSWCHESHKDLHARRACIGPHLGDTLGWKRRMVKVGKCSWGCE